MEEILTKFDNKFSKPRVERRYPYIQIAEKTDALAVVIDGLGSGSLPILIVEKNVEFEIARVPKTIKTFVILLKIFTCTIFINEKTKLETKNINDIFYSDINWET